jgi:hypothetical protein
VSLRRELTNLLPEPLEVQCADVTAIESDNARNGIIETFEQSDNGTFAATTRTDQGCSLTGDELGSKALEDRYIRTGRVVEYDVLVN